MDEDFNMTVAIMGIKNDLATVKTDIAWMKRVCCVVVVVVGGLFGADLTGAI